MAHLSLFCLVLCVAGAASQNVHTVQFNCLTGDTCGTNAAAACAAADATDCGQVCGCNNGYIGRTDCAKPPECTTDADCQNGGTCTSNACVCTNGYTGRQCGVAPICTASGNECGSHGKCATCNNAHECQCKDGYGGNLCEIPPQCEAHGDCGTYGFCQFGRNPYVCECTHGYGGDKCTMAPYCTTNGFECGTRGTCQTNVNPYRCGSCNNPNAATNPLCNGVSLPSVSITTGIVLFLVSSYFNL